MKHLAKYKLFFLCIFFLLLFVTAAHTLKHAYDPHHNESQCSLCVIGHNIVKSNISTNYLIGSLIFLAIIIPSCNKIITCDLFFTNLTRAPPV